jgi:hypothetical protein
MATIDQLRDLTRYLIDQVWQHGRQPGRTRLMKLLYLLDVDYANLTSGKTWSGLPWRFYHYGPYSPDLQRLLDRMDGTDIEDKQRHGVEGMYHVYTGAHGAADHIDLERLLDSAGRTALQTVVHQWAGADLNDLLDHVYFDTAPMRHAKRGDLLDFRAAVESFERRRVRNVVLSEPILSGLRDRLHKQSDQRSSIPIDEITRPLTDIEARILSRAEGRRAIPEGIVELDLGRES